MATIRIDNPKGLPAKAIIHEWLQKTADMLARHDVEGHLALISKQLKVYGVPELKAIDYKD